MENEKTQNENETIGGNEMNTTASPVVSLTTFIKTNEDLLFQITPKNPFVKQDDEWRVNENDMKSKDSNSPERRSLSEIRQRALMKRSEVSDGKKQFANTSVLNSNFRELETEVYKTIK